MLAFSFLHLSFIGTIASIVQHCSSNFFFCGSSKSTVVFSMDKTPGARPCAHECLLGRSVADIMCIAVYIQYVLHSPLRPLARPCILEKSPFTITLGLALGESWLLLAHPQKSTDVYKGLFPWEGFPRQTCNNHLRRKQGCSPEKALNLSVSVRLTNCNVATCWQVELSKLSLLQLSFNIHSSNGFSCPIKFFHLKIAIGLALGESWGVACATTEKHWCPVSTFACFPGKAFPGKPI